MNKEYLEAFKNLKQELYYSPNQIPDVDKWHETIEQALQRLEAIDNANPSEALEELENVIEEITIGNADLRNTLKTSVLIATIKQALIKAQINEKVLSIIKEKLVDVCELKICIDEYDDSLYQYNKRMNIKQFKLTQEEFELLKRW